ncbi:histone deacetylase 6 [Elysia marginata]|uniref:Histone deacetylase 6 n=1 Tax=Elysia marginata TaxID=1093978 RepID=A0AAV4F5P0_9GAST|nr:histone deacetylase 6 [Elysia marginata]
MQIANTLPARQYCNLLSDSDRCTAVVFDKRLESHYSQWNAAFTEKPLRTIQILRRCSELNLLERCHRIPVREATISEIFTYHTKAHLDLLESTASMDEEQLKEISRKYDYIYFHQKSSQNAKLALGGVIDLVEAIVAEKVSL